MTERHRMQTCPRLNFAAEELSWEGLSFFESALRLPMHYVDGPAGEFFGGEVRLAWSGGEVLVFADLSDRGLVYAGPENPRPLFLTGDVFELFLRDVALGTGYTETHISPAGVVRRLVFSSAEVIGELRAKRLTIADVSVDPAGTGVWVRESEGGWQVLARVPWFAESDLSGREALVSFSRYDYSPRGGEPVLSSTSRHAEVDFHRQQEWTPVVFGC